MNNKVKAAVMVRPGKIETQYFQYPTVEPGGLIIRMEMSGVCGTDKHTYEGRSKQYAGTPAETDTPFPIIPGHENVGIIEEIGSKDGKTRDFYGNELKVGDRITMCPDLVCGTCWYCRNTFGYPWCEKNKAYGNAFSCTEAPYLLGGWAEYMCIKPGTFIYKVPDGIDPQVAVLSEVFTVSYAVDAAKEAYSLAGLGWGAVPTVVVIGAGPMGLCCVIRARIMGAGDIIVLDKSPARLEMARQFGADYTVNVDAIPDSGERIQYVNELTDGRGADVVVECAGNPHSFVEGLEMLRRCGTCIEAGNFVDTGTASLNVNRLVCTKNVRIIGVSNHPFTEYGRTLKIFEKYGKEFPFEKIVTHSFSIDEAEKALLRSMDLDTMKVVVTP
jgi:threonine dehydrogenase-like Zn-dependent dehydrogenase